MQKIVLISLQVMIGLLFNVVLTEDGIGRKLSTDRPDKTESPYSVERGRFQFELQPFSLSFKNSDIDDSTTEKLRTGDFGGIAKYGLSDNADIQLVLMYSGVSQWTEGRVSGKSKFPVLGFSDPQVRLKYNLKGNDNGGPAVAIMPYLSIPIGAQRVTADAWETGLMVPVGFAVGDRLGVAVMGEVDYIANDAGDSHHLELVTSASTAIAISGALGVYFELFQSVDLAGNEPWTPTFDSGLTVGVGEDMQLDFGINLGLNRYADDFNPFLGLSFRL